MTRIQKDQNKKKNSHIFFKGYVLFFLHYPEMQKNKIALPGKTHLIFSGCIIIRNVNAFE